MVSNNNNKIGRNDKCFCGSGKKYKVCCLSKAEEMKRKELEKYTNGQEGEPSEYTKICMEYLMEEYPDHKVINITNDLRSSNYRNYHVTNYTEKVLMVAERTPENNEVFVSRGGPECNMIVMYRGSYRSFPIDQMDQVTESIDKMIQTRLAGEEDN